MLGRVRQRRCMIRLGIRCLAASAAVVLLAARAPEVQAQCMAEKGQPADWSR